MRPDPSSRKEVIAAAAAAAAESFLRKDGFAHKSRSTCTSDWPCWGLHVLSVRFGIQFSWRVFSFIHPSHIQTLCLHSTCLCEKCWKVVLTFVSHASYSTGAISQVHSHFLSLLGTAIGKLNSKWLINWTFCKTERINSWFRFVVNAKMNQHCTQQHPMFDLNF